MNKRIQSFRHAFRGVGHLITTGVNSKIQLVCGILVIVAGVVFNFTINEWIAVTICIGAVLSAEAMNSALEQLANEVSEEKRERIKRAKDMAAASVLIMSLASLVVAALIVIKRLS